MIFVAVAAALVGVGVAFGWVVAFISVKMKATKPPASAGGGQAQGGVTLSAPTGVPVGVTLSAPTEVPVGVTLSAPTQSTNENKI